MKILRQLFHLSRIDRKTDTDASLPAQPASGNVDQTPLSMIVSRA